MRKNLHPQWGYLASAPSLIRTIPTVLLGMVIGVTASGGVVLSLVDQPASQTSAVARTSAPPVRAAPTPVSAPEIEQPAEVHPDEAAAKPTTPPTTVAAPVESKAIKKLPRCNALLRAAQRTIRVCTERAPYERNLGRAVS